METWDKMFDTALFRSFFPALGRAAKQEAQRRETARRLDELQEQAAELAQRPDTGELTPCDCPCHDSPAMQLAYGITVDPPECLPKNDLERKLREVLDERDEARWLVAELEKDLAAEQMHSRIKVDQVLVKARRFVHAHTESPSLELQYERRRAERFESLYQKERRERETELCRAAGQNEIQDRIERFKMHRLLMLLSEHFISDAEDHLIAVGEETTDCLVCRLMSEIELTAQDEVDIGVSHLAG